MPRIQFGQIVMSRSKDRREIGGARRAKAELRTDAPQKLRADVVRLRGSRCRRSQGHGGAVLRRRVVFRFGPWSKLNLPGIGIRCLIGRRFPDAANALGQIYVLQSPQVLFRCVKSVDMIDA